ncbi:MAG TPA: VapC toxin family PIN domain ribonuclease [Chloroflexi bacterium]|nr:VapC toxin family PIN domain ribonuclease [Chloroflexota bacterium]
MIVVDTNVIGYLYLTSKHSNQAEQVLVKEPRWAAPLLWRSEFRNVLALYIRKGLLSVQEALQIMDEALTLMQGREYEVASLSVLGLMAGSTCSAYDCEFVALAQDLEVPLVSVDRQVLEQFPETAVSLEQFVAA